MRNGFLSIICCAVLFAIFLLLVIVRCGDGRTTIVDDDGEGEFTTVQDAINVSSDGDVIHVWDGWYRENIVIDKPISVIGNFTRTKLECRNDSDAISIIADNITLTNVEIENDRDYQNNSGIVIEANYTSISNVMIRFFSYGMFINNSYFGEIEHCRVSHSRLDGIKLVRSSYFTLLFNDCDHNDNSGISLYMSSWNNITYNACSNSFWGIGTYISTEIILTNNDCKDNTYGIHLGWWSNDCIVKNNDCRSNEIGIIVESSENLLVSNECNSNYDSGLFVLGDRNRIDGIECTFAIRGIRITSNENLVINASCSYNRDGITVSGNSNIIQGHDIAHNSIGMYIHRGNYTNISQGKISDNEWGVLTEKNAMNVTIAFNDIVNNTEYGVISQSDNAALATQNWWGHASGPYHEDKNERGKGNEVKGTVGFSPWLKEPSQSNLADDDDIGDGDDESKAIIGAIGFGAIGVVVIISLSYRREDVRFLMFSLLMKILYTKLKKDGILGQSNRHDAYQHIINRPGINLTKLHKDLPMGYGTRSITWASLKNRSIFDPRRGWGVRCSSPRERIGSGRMVRCGFR